MLTFVGLDIETSGLDPDVHKTIQIGVVTQEGSSFSSIVGWPYEELLPAWTQRSYEVHKITFDDVHTGPPAEVVDMQLLRFLENSTSAKNLIPVGWNVGSFDMQFVRRIPFPYSSKLFSYRSVDLNAVCFHIAETFDVGWSSLKKRAKAYAEDRMPNIRWHNACDDARAALYSWEWLQSFTAQDPGRFDDR